MLSRTVILSLLLGSVVECTIARAEPGAPGETRPAPIPEPRTPRGLPQPVPVPDPRSGDSKVWHLLQAAEHLRAAGFADLAAKAEQEARQIARRTGYVERRQDELRQLRVETANLEREVSALTSGDTELHRVTLAVQFLEIDHSKFGERRAEWYRTLLPFDKREPAELARLDQNYMGLVQSSATSGVEFQALIESLVKAGVVTVRAEPRLTTVDGQLGTFLTPLPIEIVQANPAAHQAGDSQSGLSLMIVPTIQTGDLVRCQILLGFGAIDPAALGRGEVPKVGRRVQTTCEVRSGQSWFLGGYRLAEKTAVPGREGPNDAAKSERPANADRRELVVVVTPVIEKELAVVPTGAPRPIAPPFLPAAQVPAAPVPAPK